MSRTARDVEPIEIELMRGGDVRYGTQKVPTSLWNVSNLINSSLRKRLGFNPQESGQMQPTAEHGRR